TLYGHLQLFGNDLPQNGIGACPRLKDRGMDDHRPIRVERHRGVGLASCWRPFAHGDAAPDVGSFRGVVPGRSHGCLQGLLCPYALVARPDGGFSPGLDEILQPKVEWISPQLLGNAVDMGLDGKDGLRLSRGAHEATWDSIGIHLHALDVHMGYLIRPTCLRSSAQVDSGYGLKAAIGTAVEHHPGLMRHHGTVAFHPSFELDNSRVAGSASRPLLDVVHDHPHRTASAYRQEVSQGDVHGGALAPVVTANGDRIQADMVFGEPQRDRELLLDLVWHL